MTANGPGIDEGWEILIIENILLKLRIKSPALLVMPVLKDWGIKHRTKIMVISIHLDRL